MSGKVLSLCGINDIERIHSTPALSLFLSLTSLACLMAVITIALNCIFLATILSQKRVQKSIANKLLMTLSFVDLLIGVLVWPLASTINFKNYSIDVNCDLVDVTLFLGYHFGILTLSAIFIVALEQYLAILHPYFYISKVTYFRLIWPIIVFNIIVLLTSIVVKIRIRVIWMHFVEILLLPIAVLIIVSLVYMYKKIIECALRVAANINSINREEGRKIKSRAKASKSSLIILIGTLVCYSPIICYNTYTKIGKQTPYNLIFFGYPSQIIAIFTSVVDPVVYYWRLSALRKATRDMFILMCKIKNQVRGSCDASKHQNTTHKSKLNETYNI